MSELTTTQQQSTEVVQRTPAQELVARVRTDEFAAQVSMVLPENVPPSRFVRGTVTALLANPDIAKIEDWDSIFVALLRSAQDGLLPDGRESAIVAYGKKASYLPMIGGIRKVAGEFGWTIDTKVVRANDEFSYEYGLDPKITHRPATGDRGALVYAYAIGRHRDGRRELEVMDATEIAKVKKASRAASKGPWVDWEERMWEKSVGHRIFKRLPLDPSDKRVASIIDAGQLGPEASANMLYGQRGATFVAREVDASKDTPAATADAAQLEAGGGQQEATGEAAPGDEPGTDGAPVAAPDGQGSFPIPDAVVDEAGAVLVQPEWSVSRTCGDANGAEYVRAVLAGEHQDVDETVVSAMRTYVTARHPELLPSGGS